ncbi:MAG: hypothetical protein AABX11_02630 [Nanoarchaeota archaeon]
MASTGIRKNAKQNPNWMLKGARESLGLSRSQVQRATGVKIKNLHNYESRGVVPSLETQRKLCAFYTERGQVLLQEEVFPDRNILEDRIPEESLVPLEKVNEAHPAFQVETDHVYEHAMWVVDSLLPMLDERRRKVIRLAYGLEDGNDYGTEEIARTYFGGEITRSRVGQIRDRAIKILSISVTPDMRY